MTTAAIDRARQFYSYDSELNSQQRQELSTAFRILQSWPAMGSMGLLAVGIMLPRSAAKRGFTSKMVSTRTASVGLGFIGFIVGGKLGFKMANSRNIRTLEASENAKKAYEMLAVYPAQLGFAYYRATSHNSSVIMPNPDRVDWSKEAPFPFNLIRPTIDRRRPQATVQHDGHSQVSQPSSNKVDFEDHSFDSSNNKADNSESTSSWNQVRESGTTNLPRTPRNFPKPPPKINQPSVEEEQSKFDMELERERSGSSMSDDFSDSEKKWS